MANHEVKIVETVEKVSGEWSGDPDATLASVEVKPPITVGERFSSVILGIDGYGARVSEVGSTQESTILFVESAGHNLDRAGRLAMINGVVARVALFADKPEVALQMLQENPFPNDPNWSPSLI